MPASPPAGPAARASLRDHLQQSPRQWGESSIIESEPRQMEMFPFPDDREPTLRDLVTRLEQTHQCVELSRRDTRDLDAKVTALIARVEGKIDGLVTGFGIRSEHPVRPPKVHIKWDLKTAFAVVGSMGGVLVLFRVLNAIWPILIKVPLQ